MGAGLLPENESSGTDAKEGILGLGYSPQTRSKPLEGGSMKMQEWGVQLFIMHYADISV